LRSLVEPFNWKSVIVNNEYCSTVWDSHLRKDINELEKVQRRAARWAMSNYSWSSSVTSMLELLQWPIYLN